MANLSKNHELYRKIVNVFNDLSRGNHLENLEFLVSKAHILFLDNYKSTMQPEYDFGKKRLNEIEDYCYLLSKRKKVKIAGGKRDIATEEEALSALILTESIAKNLLLPLFRKKNGFSNRVFNDIHNLSLSYVHAIVNGVGAEYINKEEAFEAKQRAVSLAKQGIRVFDSYKEEGFGENTKEDLKRFKRFLSETQRKFMRSFENVPTSQKKIYKGSQLMKQLSQEITEQEEDRRFLFKPEIILPIAQGGIEFGVRVANVYEDKGHFPIVYPLLYSIKTKKHRHPWIEHDAEFLGQSLEGQNILVTEDWVTTGNTLRGILNKLENTFPNEIRVATIKRDPNKSQVPFLENYKFYIGALANYSGNKTDSLTDL